MDSCVTLAHAIADGYTPAALHVNYGQHTQQRELQAFQDICDHYNITQRLVVDISHLAAIGGSALTGDLSGDLTGDPSGDLSGEQRSIPQRIPRRIPQRIPRSTSEIPATYVPFRNANILAIATSWAEVIGASALYIGAVEEDSSGYPDCTEAFFRAFQAVIDTGTKPETKIEIRTPVIHHRKSQIVLDGERLHAPLHLSWSCYFSEGAACGTCGSCTLRLKGFREAGRVDPITYR